MFDTIICDDEAPNGGFIGEFVNGLQSELRSSDNFQGEVVL